MSETAPITQAPQAAVHEDRVLPAVVYGLYLVGVGHLTAIVGLIIAYASREGAAPVAASHFTYQIRTFWLSIWWFVVGILLCIGGAIFSVVLIGIPFLIAGCLMVSAVWLYMVIRSIVGLVYLAQGEPHPRPDGWLF